MQVTITTRHIEIDASLKAHTEERVAKIAHFSERLGDVAVVLWSERHLFVAEMKTHSGGQDLVSSAEADDARSAIDGAAVRLERQVRELRAREIQRKSRPGIDPTLNILEPPA